MHYIGLFLSHFKNSEVWQKTLILLRQSSNSSCTRNPYEVLGLKKTCSTGEIKKAYIKLCKELHPDKKPGDKSQHKKFVELNNAYSTLINVESRKEEDTKREQFYGKHKNGKDPFNFTQEDDRAWYEKESYWEYYKQQNTDSSSNRPRSHKLIVLGCFILIFGGSVLYFIAYRYASSYKTTTVDERSRRIRESYDLVKKNSSGSKDEQLEKLKKRWSV